MEEIFKFTSSYFTPKKRETLSVESVVNKLSTEAEGYPFVAKIAGSLFTYTVA